MPAKFKQIIRKISQKLDPSIITGIISLILIFIFIKWIAFSFLPLIWMETKYQTRQMITAVFKVNSVQEIFNQNFSELNWHQRSKYKDYGIVIPAISLDEPVIFNVDPNDEKAYKKALKKGIVHASSTAFPDNGGIGYYFAHSSSEEFISQYNAVFYLISKLEKDDQIFIWHENQKHEYRVTESVITSPEDVSFINKGYDQETIVLQTCWPPGTTKQRMLVFAKRSENN